tara:strand:- start:569 stop:934 length:366 start_codon:yes stop_codon:yes gene_type:complete
MKFTKTELRQIIKEELRTLLSERDFRDMDSPNQMSGMSTTMSPANLKQPKVQAIADKLQPGEFTNLGGLLYVKTNEGEVMMAADHFADDNDPEGRGRAREPERQRAQAAEKELLDQGYIKV